MAQADPQEYVASSSKKLRDGRIFVDYLRNGRGATAVASYSLRARPDAPVAVPLRWDELGRLARPDKFNIDTVPRRLARLDADPWEGIDAVSQDIATLAERFNRKG
jgi:bifunctional non-homologous end joining protein LigD